MSRKWVNDYIGIPYLWGGRSRQGLDCYGLVVLVYREQYGIELPDWVGSQMDLRSRAKAIEEAVCSGDFTVKDRPCEGDFVVCYRSRYSHHIGLHFSGGILHAVEGAGVVYIERRHFERDHINVEYGAWTP